MANRLHHKKATTLNYGFGLIGSSELIEGGHRARTVPVTVRSPSRDRTRPTSEALDAVSSCQPSTPATSARVGGDSDANGTGGKGSVRLLLANPSATEDRVGA